MAVYCGGSDVKRRSSYGGGKAIEVRSWIIRSYHGAVYNLERSGRDGGSSRT